MSAMEDTIDELEDVVDEDIDSSRFNDPEWWRRVAYRYKKNIEEIKELKFMRDKIVEKYDSLIQTRKQEFDGFGVFLEMQLQQSKFTTKSGGFKVDMFPDIGVFSLRKEALTFEVTDQDYWINKGFARVIPEEKRLDKKGVNEYLKSLNLDTEMGRVIDKSTGEVMPGVSAIKKRSFRFKQGD